MSSTEFKTGGPLTQEQAELYITREADREALRHIQAMEYLLIIEPRQQGKTSLVNRLMYHPSLEGKIFLYIDISSCDRSSEAAWYQTLCKRLLIQLVRSVTYTQWPSIPQNSAEWRDFLYDLARIALFAQKYVIVVLDEIGWAKFPGLNGFFSVLRDIYTSRQSEPEFKRVTFILVGTFHPRDLIEDDAISPFNIAQQVRLSDFTLSQIHELVSKSGMSSNQIDVLSERIYYWTHGQPYLTQLLCSCLLTNTTADDVDHIIDRLFREDKNHLPPLIKRLNKDKKLHDYVLRISVGEKIKFAPNINTRQAELEILGIIRADREGFCSIRNQLYQQVLSSMNLSSMMVAQQQSRDLNDRDIVEPVSISFEKRPDSVESTQRQLSPGDEKPIIALVMKGGGVKGLAYIGALRELEIYYQFDWFIGTSAGAIAAVLLGVGYSTDELEKILSEKNFLDFLDAKIHQWPINLLFHGGVFPAYTFTDWIDDLLAKKLDLPVRVTLGDLPNRVTIYASRQEKGALVFDSRDPRTKDTPAAYAVRCSMSIPFIFTPQTDADMSVLDGGMRNNYPVNELLRNYPGTNFIGLYLGSEHYEGGSRRRSLIGELLAIWTESTDIEALKTYHKQTVIIDPRPISTIDFNLSNMEKEFLIKSGKMAALKFLLKQNMIEDGSQSELGVVRKEVEGVHRSITITRGRRNRNRVVVIMVVVILLVSFYYIVFL